MCGRNGGGYSRAWIKGKQVRVEKDKIVEYRVDMKATFIVHDED